MERGRFLSFSQWPHSTLIRPWIQPAIYAENNLRDSTFSQ